MPSYDLVVYGGNPWAISAAVAAKKVASAISVALVVDYPDMTVEDALRGGFSSTRRLGGIYTIGGEITWDDYGVAGGTYRYNMFSRTGRHYNPDSLADLLQNLLSRHGIDVYFGYHLSDLSSTYNSDGHHVVSSITLRPIALDSDHYYAWDPNRPSVTLNADFFVDASTDGRLISTVTPESVTVGRYDWPADRLTPSERNGGMVQSATLSIRLGNFDTDGEPGGEWRRQVLQKGGAIYNYNLDLFDRTSERLFCGTGDWTAEDETTIWATGAHVFNVDPRAFEKDRGSDLFPSDMPDDAYTYDQGYAELRTEIESGRWIDALRNGLDMPALELLTVAPAMYVREGLHSVLEPSRKSHRTEETNYAVRASDAILAGYSGTAGVDGRFYWQRMGVAFYGIDLHAYTFRDLYDPSAETFFWRPDVEQRMRPDLAGVRSGWWNPGYGVWLPFEMIVPRDTANILLCGYNVSASSVAWGEIREAPNLCVLGDACGATVGTLFTHGGYSLDVADLIGEASFISLVQNALVELVGANLDTKRRKYPTLKEAA